MSSRWSTRRIRSHNRFVPHPGPALRLALRSFRREPATSFAAIVTLGLGIGAAATIFAVLHGFNRPLPVPEGERVVRIRTLDVRRGTDLPAGPDALEAWASGVPALQAIGAYKTSSPLVAPANTPPFRASAAALSPEILPLLRVAPQLGRLPRAAPEGEPREVAIAERLWRVHFGADPGVLGGAIQLDGRSAVLVGVMPEFFGFPLAQNLWWVSSRLGRQERSMGGAAANQGPIRLVGRLAEGASTEVASVQLGVRFARYHQAVAPGGAEPEARVVGFTEDRGESGENVALRALLALVVLLVLVSCANVANLLHSRSVERAHLLTVHAALGAGPGQVALQVLGEAFFLALAGGAFGLLGGWGASSYIETTLSGNWGYHWMRVGIDPAVVLFAAGLVVVVTVAAGIAPALRSGRLDLAGALKARVADESARDGWASRTLLGAQVAFSAAALVAAALMATGLVWMRSASGDLPGEAVLISSVSLDAERYAERSQRADLRDRLRAALVRTGARGAVLTTGIPGFRGEPAALELEGIEQPAGSPSPHALVAGVTPGYFAAFDLRMLRGRGFEPGDVAGPDPVAVVSSSFARRHFGAEDPIGARIRLSGETQPDGWVRVVGIVESPGGEVSGQDWVYVPIERRDPASFFLALRARSGDAHRLAPALRDAVRSVDPELPLDPSMLGAPTYTLEEILDYVGRFYRTTGLLSLIGAVGAVLVALLGLYGVLTLDIRRRVRELGIRMALGAERRGVVWRILRRGIARVLPGLLLGLVLAWVAAPAFGVFLAGAEPRDSRIFGLAAALYLLGILVTSGSPALRAARTDPARVLREE